MKVSHEHFGVKEYKFLKIYGLSNCFSKKVVTVHFTTTPQHLCVHFVILIDAKWY